MEDEELVKIFNLTLKRRETILLFLIVVINELLWIDLDIELDTRIRGRWMVEVTHLMDYLFVPFHSSLDSNFVRSIEPINRLIQIQSKWLQYTLKKKKSGLFFLVCVFSFSSN